MRSLRVVAGVVKVDKRKYYSFITPDGRVVETKADSKEQAKELIESTLEIKIQEAA